MHPRNASSEAVQPLQHPEQPVFRSGSVARMAGMPVSTLRIWEQRYQAVGPSTSPSGHRLYSAAQVERVVLLRQLTEQGHAIGSLAGLDIDQLRQVALAQASVETTMEAETSDHLSAGPAHPSPDLAAELRSPLRMVVVGQAMARRLRRAAVLRACVRPPQVVAVFDSLTEALLGAASSSHQGVDVLLWQTTGLQEGLLPELMAAREAWSPRRAVVAYRFAGGSAGDAFAAAGATVVREPSDDASLGAWLAALEAALPENTRLAATSAGDTRHGAAASPTGPANFWRLPEQDQALPARRFDDATLTDFAGLSSGVACDCPSHVAELLMQIAGFEAYSAECTDRSPADAQLHAYLHRTAGVARVLFEKALERVALAEGWALP
ncbi:MAG: MerR family transcriptional regulator [Acidovorax sp.]|uniref:MerR family transcriptional regulator n=1 Tax=Acidovorax sp. TaxID=1872122 RepID=UPI00391BA92E